MCGIAGFNYENKNLIKCMCDLIVHRGPDDWGFFMDSEVTIGMRRLSIIDLITGGQPQHNENKDIWIVFNGEIFNYLELRQELEKYNHKFYTNSDTEVIIHGYEEWGKKCVERLRGQFSFCIYDSKKEILFLARDHMGLKPLYYYFDGNRFIFGSEIKSILCHDIRRVVNKRALNLCLSLKYVPFGLTLFKGVYKLPPARFLVFDLNSKKISIERYWNFNFKKKNHRTTEVIARELKKLIEESIKIRLISDVPLGAFLSGGLDSTSVVGIMSRFLDEPVKTFSIIFEEGAPVNEAKYSRLASEYYNTDHKELVVKSASYKILPELIWYLDDLITDAAIIPTYLMAKYAREKIKVTLTGDGADEVFAGYSIYYKSHIIKYPRNLPRKPLDFVMKYYNHIPSHKVKFALSYINKSKSEEDCYIRTLLTIPDIEKPKVFPYKVDNVETLIKKTYMKNVDLVNQFSNWDLKYQLPSQYNMKIDKMTMAVSLETRVPFLDYKIVEWASTIPSELKLKGNVEKYILRLAMKDILPPEILKRKKMGFGTPVNLWLKTGMKEISGELLDRLTKRTELIKPSYIKTIKKNRLNKYYQAKAWSLIMFELWYETFIENERLKPISL